VSHKKARLLINYKATSTYALNVILGALECARDSNQIDISLVPRASDLGEAIRESLREFERVLVAWSFYSPEFAQMSLELRKVKALVSDPRLLHIAGGVHATAQPEQTLRAGFDIVAIGEGEKTIAELAPRLVTGEDLTQSRGIGYLADGRFTSNGTGELIDLDDFPPYAPQHKRFNPIEITRGCIYACRFCQTPFMFKARFRHRTIKNICHYVQTMKDHGLTEVRFITPTSLSYGSTDESVNMAAVEELLSSVRSIIGSNGRIFFGTFPSEVRPEHVTPGALLTLKKYVNNDNLVIGGQSGSLRVLDSSHRGHDVDCIVDAVGYSLAAGFLPNVDFIFGLPGETPEDIRASLDLAERLAGMGARIHGHTFMPLPGTPFQLAPPGAIPGWAMHRLKRLESRGRLYGQWKQQVSIAKSLATSRTYRGKYEQKTLLVT